MKALAISALGISEFHQRKTGLGAAIDVLACLAPFQAVRRRLIALKHLLARLIGFAGTDIRQGGLDRRLQALGRGG